MFPWIIEAVSQRTLGGKNVEEDRDTVKYTEMTQHRDSELQTKRSGVKGYIDSHPQRQGKTDIEGYGQRQ